VICLTLAIVSAQLVEAKWKNDKKLSAQEKKQILEAFLPPRKDWAKIPKKYRERLNRVTSLKELEEILSGPVGGVAGSGGSMPEDQGGSGDGEGSGPYRSGQFSQDDGSGEDGGEDQGVKIGDGLGGAMGGKGSGDADPVEDKMDLLKAALGGDDLEDDNDHADPDPQDAGGPGGDPLEDLNARKNKFRPGTSLKDMIGGKDNSKTSDQKANQLLMGDEENLATDPDTPNRPTGLPKSDVMLMLKLLQKAANHRKIAEEQLLLVGNIFARNGFKGKNPGKNELEGKLASLGKGQKARDMPDPIIF